MADSTMDANGLSVASRIRMFQNNVDSEAPPKPKRGISPRGSPKPELKSQPSGGHIGTQFLPSDSTKFAEKIVSSRRAAPRQASPQSASPRSSPPRKDSPTAVRHKGHDLNLDEKPTKGQTDTHRGQKSPRPSPKPSLKPSPQLERKEFENIDSQKSKKVVNKERKYSSETKENVSRTSSQELTKPPLPNKPSSLVIKEGESKDINDNCHTKSALSGKMKKPGYPKKPLVVAVSSGNSTVDKDRRNSREESENRTVSIPSSIPLPLGPKSKVDEITQHSFSEDGIAEKTEISNAKRKRDNMIQHSYETVDKVYEEPDSPGQEGEFSYDNEYEDPGPSSPTESIKSSQLNDRDRKILSRINTSRRPPPLPIQNQRDSKKNAKAPPLPSRNAVHTAEDQALYSYAAEPELFQARTPSFKPTTQDSSYETPDAGSVRGLMIGLQNNHGDYETPDAASVNEFIANVNTDNTDDYETPDQEAVRDFTDSIQDKKHVERTFVESDSDSDAYCDPETVRTLAEKPCSPAVPVAPRKSLPPPPAGEGSDQDSSDEDISHDYEDPMEDLWSRPRHVSLRRVSQPVLNPDAYLSLQEMDMDSLYQDPAEALSTMPNHRWNAKPHQPEDEYEDLSDEPLYQVYAADVLSEMRKKSEKGYEEDDVFSEYSTGGIESGQRVLWCQLPSVRNSGVLTDLEPREKKRQEAMFEVITSEASYLKSLNILVSHFMSEFSVKPDVPPEESIIDKQQYRFLFGGLSMIKSTSEKFLHSLRGKQEENFIISSISDIVVEYATTYFECYVKYCSNQVYQERTLMTLVNENEAFCDLLGKLESSTRSQGLSMQSFLMLPMQRITRLPLLVDAICHHCEPGSEEFQKTDSALSAIHKVVKECNEGARKMERIEEMYFIQQMLSFKVKPIPIVSSSRWLLRRGELACLEGEKKIRAFKSLLRGGKYYRIYLFLFNDLLLVSKMKSENSFKVVDHCARGMIHIDDEYVPTGDTLKPGLVGVPSSKFMFTLILLENHQGKTTRYVCFAENETEKIRWLDALTPPKPVCDKDGEKIYEEWDCPQVRAIHAYQPDQPDELTLREGDVIKVLRKLPDGWYEGQHLVGGEQGWFPANHSEEIRNEHTRARNLMQRYRLINTVSMAFDPKAKKL